MKLEPFLMERMQSTYEHRVAINLSESGVDPMTVRELLDGTSESSVLDQQLIYTQSNGTDELRRTIAALYDGAGEDHVEVTTGCAEANHLAVWHLVELGDEVVMTVPNYMQIWGLVRAYGAKVKEWRMRPDPAAGRWTLDMDELASLVTDRTRLILLCNPNNPTGSCLNAQELDTVARVAERHGAWVLSDEVYRGSEHEGEETPSMWGRADRVIVTCGLSKAYGLPGLRLGWIVAPEEQIARFWSYHDYTTICPSALSDRLARLALDEAHRPRILQRTRTILRESFAAVAEWLGEMGDTFTYVPPQATAAVYVKYDKAVNSTHLAERLRVEKDVLIVPGDHFLMDGHLRLGFGSTVDHLQEGLSRIHQLLRTI